MFVCIIQIDIKFQNLSNNDSFGIFFPKLDFEERMIYTRIRGERYDRENRIS